MNGPQHILLQLLTFAMFPVEATKYAGQGIHLDFERHHQKAKTGVSVALQKGLYVLQKCKKKSSLFRIDPDELPHYPIELLRRREIRGAEEVYSDSGSEFDPLPFLVQVTNTQLQVLSEY